MLVVVVMMTMRLCARSCSHDANEVL